MASKQTALALDISNRCFKIKQNNTANFKNRTCTHQILSWYCCCSWRLKKTRKTQAIETGLLTVRWFECLIFNLHSSSRCQVCIKR